ncbi:MAG: NTP transferase domain-containing protein [Solirubrobacterales bacterium]
MPTSPEPFVAGLLLAAGGSRRLGQPKQLLPYGEGTLLDHTLATARACGFDQLLVALGGAAEEVRDQVDLAGAQVIENPSYGEGCASSIGAALPALDRRCEVLVLLLGDQPGVRAEAVAALLAGRGEAALAVCRYEDGRGHPLAFGRGAFGDLAAMHGDKAVWKLLERRAGEVVEVPVPGPIPPDVDTWEDYEAALAAVGSSR